VAAPRIEKATIERMLLAYIKNPNPTHVARSCGVSWAAAKKYITDGAPALGIGPFATEARQILRAQDKLVRLTEVTKEIRVQVEEKDLGAYQDLLFEFESVIHEGLGLVKARIVREKEYFAGLDAAMAAEDLDAAARLVKPRAVNMNDLRAIAVALHELIGLKREFWDRIEVVRRTEVEIGGGAEGLTEAQPSEPPPDFESWEPHEIAAYVDSIEAGRDPVYPEGVQNSTKGNTSIIPDTSGSLPEKSASPITDKEGPEEFRQSPSVYFPPGGEDEGI
jgi:hypothetical protein